MTTATSASPTAQTQTRWPATATSPARSIDQSQGGSGTQVAGQDNSSGQSAEAAAVALQDKPSNTAVGIRVLSPGDDGNVHQSNSADANALAGNINLTGQTIDQSQGGTAAPLTAPCGCQSGTQVAGQSNENWQDAGALAVAAQDKPSNTAVGIRVLSPGDDGNVGQSNSADANALAGNGNLTGQSIDQSQSGSGTQVAGQDNSSGQSADAAAVALQDKPSNTAVGIRVLSPGDDGNVHQSNSADANALAGNINLTGQTIDQSQGGTAAPLTAPCGCQSGTQVAGQSNENWQDAGALAVAAQDKPSNTAVGIRVLSPVTTATSASPTAQTQTRWPATATSQARSIDQSQGGSGTQVAGQENASGQSAEAAAVAPQDKPSNTAVGIRVLSPGDNGNVDQSNSADANALAGNVNLTGQTIDQSQWRRGAGVGVARSGRRPVEREPAGCIRRGSRHSCIRRTARRRRSRRRLRVWLRAPLAHDPRTGVGQRGAVEQRRCECAGWEREPHRPERSTSPLVAARGAGVE